MVLLCSSQYFLRSLGNPGTIVNSEIPAFTRLHTQCRGNSSTLDKLLCLLNTFIERVIEANPINALVCLIFPICALKIGTYIIFSYVKLNIYKSILLIY